MRSERPYLSTLLDIGFTPKEAVELMSDEVIGSAQASTSPSEGLVDASDREEGGNVIGWMNDIENDAQYVRFATSLNGVS